MNDMRIRTLEEYNNISKQQFRIILNMTEPAPDVENSAWGAKV